MAELPKLKPFPSTKETSSAPSDPLDGYAPPTDESGVDPIVGVNVAHYDRTTRTQAPASATDSGGRWELVGGTNVGASNTTSRPLDPIGQDGGVAGSGSHRGRHVRHLGPQFQALQDSCMESHDTNLAVERKPKRACLYAAVIIFSMCVLFLLVFLATAVTATTCKWCIQDRQSWEKIRSSEVLQDFTVLAYRGNNSDVHFTARSELESDESTPKINLTLKAVECKDLMNKTQTKRNIREYPFTVQQPVYIPFCCNHYEKGSSLSYNITSENVPAESGVTIRIFDNAEEASYYRNQGTDSDARQKAYKVQPVLTNTTFPFTFTPSFGSYFIPLFDPNITGGNFQINVSYSILQVFYRNSDYRVPDSYCCHLTSNKQCTFDFSNSTEMCVLAYNPSSYGAGNNPVSITVSTTRKKHILIPLLFSLFSFFAVSAAVAFCVCCIILCRSKTSGYSMLA